MQTRRAVELRNRLLLLLAERVGEIRAAARLLFRDNPRMLRRATSAYERKRKAKWASKKAPRATPRLPRAPRRRR